MWKKYILKYFEIKWMTTEDDWNSYQESVS